MNFKLLNDFWEEDPNRIYFRDQLRRSASLGKASALRQAFFSLLTPGSSLAPRTAVTAAALPPSAPNAAPKTHLIILVNGLFGSPSNWEFTADIMKASLVAQEPGLLIHASNCNRLLQTFEGIDMCGERLADEIRGLVRQNPSLREITVVGHSMGGLISRYALGRLFDPKTGRVGGLAPRNFVTLASPHLGCSSEAASEARLPFVEWTGQLRAVGGYISSFFDGVSVPVASLALRRTGQQLFLCDHLADAVRQRAEGGNGGRRAEPLVARMTKDWPSDRLYFLSALSAFETRTAYANIDGDHLVGWANSSLRARSQLPSFPLALRRRTIGVIREDPPGAAYWASGEGEPREGPIRADMEDPGVRRSVLQSVDWASAGKFVEEAGQAMEEGSGAERGANGGQSQAAFEAMQAAEREGAGGAGGRPSTSKMRLIEPSAAESAALAQELSLSDAMSAAYQQSILARLQSLPWRRIDVCFDGAPSPLLRLQAHNNIQITRASINSCGKPVALHLSKTLQDMIHRSREPGKPGDGGAGCRSGGSATAPPSPASTTANSGVQPGPG